MNSNIRIPVALIPEEQAPLPIEQKMRWPQIWFGCYGEKKNYLVPADNSIADFSIFQHVTYSLRRMHSPRNKTVIQWHFIIFDYLKRFLYTDFCLTSYPLGYIRSYWLLRSMQWSVFISIPTNAHRCSIK